MPNRSYLGELELMVLLAVVRLGDDAYGVPISKELRSLAGREVALGSIYAALDRLENKGSVTSLLGDPTPERGGRAKRYFRVTPAGLRALRSTRAALTRLWSGIPVLEGRRT
jgi:DNA-binding PadR family transcriptional regulator